MSQTTSPEFIRFQMGEFLTIERTIGTMTAGQASSNRTTGPVFMSISAGYSFCSTADRRETVNVQTAVRRIQVAVRMEYPQDVKS